MKKFILSCAAVALLASCGGSDKKDNKEKGHEEAAEVVVKPVNQENLLGKWEIVDHEGLLNDKGLAGKTVEFVKDSIFYYDETGNPIHRKMDFHPQYGPRIEYITMSDDGSRTTNTGPVQMNFHEMQPDLLMMTENGKIVPMKMVK